MTPPLPAIAPATVPNPHFARLGGARAVARLVDAFYRAMDTLPEAAGIRAMHAPDLGPTRALLTLYFTEWLGGPADYSAQRGHPRLRMRHGPFAIGAAERDAWLACMQQALAEVLGNDAELRTQLMNALFKTADWLRNTQGSTPP